MWRIRHLALQFLFLILLAASSSAQAGCAGERLKALRETLKKSRAASDWTASLSAAHEIEQFLHGSPTSLLEVARAEVHTGDLNDAMHRVEEFVSMGQYADLLLTSPEFAPLRARAGFAELQKQMEENRKPISLGSDAFRIPDTSLLAEDLDYDLQSKRFLITSVRQKKIVSLDESGSLRDFATSPDAWPMLAIKIDPGHGLLWATEVALQGFVFAPEKDWGKSAVLCYDLKAGRLLRRVEGPRGSALGDMVLTTDGTVIVSDGEGGGVYRLTTKGDTLERLDAGDFISPQTPAMHPDGKYVFVPDYVRGIGVLDLATRKVSWLPMQGRYALNGIDGLYYDRGTLIAVQNGTSPERVAAFKLDSAMDKIVSERIIEASTSTLGDPTHGVTVGNDFYYIANSGWDVIDDHGNTNAGAKLSEPRIMRAKVH